MTLPPYAVVYDNDGTLTRGDRGYTLMRYGEARAVPHQCRDELNALRDRYMEAYKAGRLPPEDEQRWHMEIVASYVRHHVTLYELQQSIAHVRLRPGVREEFALRRRLGIPIAIVSFGIRQLVQHLLGNNGIAPDSVDDIFAMELTFDRQGRVTGMVEGSLVIPDDKGRVSVKFAEQYGVPPDRIIAVGDSAGDKTLGHLKELRFGIAETQAQASKLREFMGQVVTTSSMHLDFTPVTDAIDLEVTRREWHVPEIVCPPLAAVEPSEIKTISLPREYPYPEPAEKRFEHLPPHQPVQHWHMLQQDARDEQVEAFDLVSFPDGTHTSQIRQWAAKYHRRPCLHPMLISIDVRCPELYLKGPTVSLTPDTPDQGPYLSLSAISGGRVLLEERVTYGRWTGRCRFAFHLPGM